MTNKNYSKYEAKEEFGTLSFNHVLLHNYCCPIKIENSDFVPTRACT